MMNGSDGRRVATAPLRARALGAIRARALRARRALAGDRGSVTLLPLLAAIAAFLLLPATGPQPQVLLLGIPVALGIAWFAGRPATAAVVVGVAALGIAWRIAAIGQTSDVLTVTIAAASRALAGLDPWGVGYAVSLPPGAPFPYGPLALVWYLPFASDPRMLELAVSIGLCVALALRGRPLGLALYALTPAFVVVAVDGSNDTSAGVLVLLAFLAAERSPALGGGVLALAVAFKPYALAWAPALVAWGGLPVAFAFVAGSGVCWGWAVVAWGVEPILRSFELARLVHAEPSRSLARLWQDLGLVMPARAWFDSLSLVLGAAGAGAAVLVVLRRRTLAIAAVCGAVVYLVVLDAGWWASIGYLAGIAPLVCWHIDDWCGLGDRRHSWAEVAARVRETALTRAPGAGRGMGPA